MRETLKVMDRLNIFGVVSGSAERVAAWHKARPERVIQGFVLQMEPGTTPDTVAALHASGALDVLGEVTTQYQGIAPDDPRLEPYWALAEKLDIPVGIPCRHRAARGHLHGRGSLSRAASQRAHHGRGVGETSASASTILRTPAIR